MNAPKRPENFGCIAIMAYLALINFPPFILDGATFALIFFGAVYFLIDDKNIPKINRDALFIAALNSAALFASYSLSINRESGGGYVISFLICIAFAAVVASVNWRFHLRKIFTFLGSIGLFISLVVFAISVALKTTDPNMILGNQPFSSLVTSNDIVIVCILFPFSNFFWKNLFSDFEYKISTICNLILILYLIVLFESKVSLLAILISISILFFQKSTPSQVKSHRCPTLIFSGFIAASAIYILWRSLQAPGTFARLDMWSSAIATFLENPVFGSGPNTFFFQRENTSFDIVRDTRGMLWAHNILIEQAVEQGVFGLVSLMMMIAFIFQRFINIKNEFIRRTLLASYASFLVASLVEITLGRRVMLTTLMYFFGLASLLKGPGKSYAAP